MINWGIFAYSLSFKLTIAHSLEVLLFQFSVYISLLTLFHVSLHVEDFLVIVVQFYVVYELGNFGFSYL
jgi:hypothetical protein